MLAALGPDPLRADADPMKAWARIRRSNRPIGDLLMDQTVLAGVGNVYRNEVLFRHRIHPLRPGKTLRVGQFQAIWAGPGRADGRGRPDGFASTPSATSTRPRRWDDHRGSTTTAARSTSTAAPDSRAWCAAPGCEPTS